MAKAANTEPPTHLAKEKIRYLALEGGGGKGATYLGAIKQLEKYKILPVQRKQFYLSDGTSIKVGHDQLRGLSGSSAGAITALMLALGMHSSSIEDLLINHTKDFESFCDVPRPGVHRTFLNGEYQLTPDISNDAFQQRRSERVKQQLRASGLNIAALLALPFLPATLTFFRVNLSQFPLSRIVTPDLQISPDFAAALLVDGGLFLGENATRFFDKLIVKELEKFGRSTVQSRSHRNITFTAFRDLTDVDLRITGTNVYTNKPHYFSADLTPTLPVALAVSISMNIPVLFKPIIIDSTLRGGSGKATEAYKGLWVDGGMLNNLPLHAFDDALSGRGNERDRSLLPLNDSIVALRLMDGRPGQTNVAGFNWTRWLGLTGLTPQIGMLMGTLMSPSEDGQIRTPLERSRTVDLYTYDLSTLNFAPSESETEEPIKQATASVKKYFEPES